MPGDLPFVTIVVPTRDGAVTLVDCVESLLAQDYPADRYEAIVVDNGSTDGAAAALPDRFPTAGDRLRVLTLDRADANGARNAGVRAARGDPVCLVDDDVIAPPAWLAALAGGLVRHGADCAGGPIRARFDAPPPRTCGRHDLAGTVLDEGPVDREIGEVWGGNMAVTRRALERAGGFREGLAFGQEWEWEQRLLGTGGRMHYVADAWLWHRRQATDLRVPGLVAEAFARGRALGRHRARDRDATAVRAQARTYAVRLRRSLAHASRARCTRGLTDAARAAGHLAGALECLLRGRIGR